MKLLPQALFYVFLVASGALSGWICGRGFPLAALLLPLLSLLQSSPTRAALGAFSFYLGAGADILATGGYLAAAAPGLSPVWLWFAVAMLQTLPWVLCWTPEPVAVG